jgi:hypothetical protein
MDHRGITLVGALAAATLMAACAAPADDAGAMAGAADRAPAKAADAMAQLLTAELTGAAEVPGPGDPDGKGMAQVTVDPTKLEVCHKLTVSGTAPAAAAHIHRAAAGQAGPPVVPLTMPATGSSEGCSTVTAELATDLLANPQNYYVNVHTPEHPPGAVRGQLKK